MPGANFSILVFGFLALGVASLGCQTASKNFVESSQQTIIHKPTGIEYPKVIRGWESSETQIVENLSPEILAELTFVHKDTTKEFNPRVSVFFMKGFSAANLQMIENKEAQTFKNSVKIKSDLGANLPRQQKMIMSSYKHSLQQVISAAGGSTLVKEVPLSSYFVQSQKNPQLVFVMTTAQKQQGDQEIVLQLMEEFLAKKQAVAQ